MFWIVMLITVAIVTLDTLAPYAVRLKVLATALQLVAFIILGIAVRFLWKRLIAEH